MTHVEYYTHPKTRHGYALYKDGWLNVSYHLIHLPTGRRVGHVFGFMGLWRCYHESKSMGDFYGWRFAVNALYRAMDAYVPPLVDERSALP